MRGMGAYSIVDTFQYFKLCMYHNSMVVVLSWCYVFQVQIWRALLCVIGLWMRKGNISERERQQLMKRCKAKWCACWTFAFFHRFIVTGCLWCIWKTLPGTKWDRSSEEDVGLKLLEVLEQGMFKGSVHTHKVNIKTGWQVVNNPIVNVSTKVRPVK